jgi:hypothetical protein
MDTATNSRANYNKAMEEFADDVKYRLENAYELVKEEDDFRAKVYTNADYSTASDDCCNFCDLAKDDEKYGYCEICDSDSVRYESWLARMYPEADIEWRENETRLAKHQVHKRYDEMSKYDAFDAFLTEPVKNAICEDLLGEILTFL